MMLTGLADVLRQAGLNVVELDGWKTRGHGQMVDVRGVTCHHTASGRGTGKTLGLSTIRDGRPGLPGPLAHLYLNREGTFYVVAAGLCYHAGVSRETGQTNSHRIGIEALAAGDGWSQDWPVVQVGAYQLGCRALADHYGFSVSQVLGHKETCAPAGRKIDPTLDMDGFRDGVRNATTQEDDVNLDDKINYTDSAEKRLKRGSDSVEFVLQWPPAVRLHRDETARGFAAVTAQLAAQNATIAALVAALADGGGLTAAQAQEAARIGAENALDAFGRALGDRLEQ